MYFYYKIGCKIRQKLNSESQLKVKRTQNPFIKTKYLIPSNCPDPFFIDRFERQIAKNQQRAEESAPYNES
jgi:hypothetical protein